MSPDPLVLVVGAGPAGLVSALALTQNGIKVRLIDKADTFQTGSRGSGIQPRTYELLRALGLIDEIQKFSDPMITMRAYKLPGGTVPLKTWEMYKQGEVSRWPDRPYANDTLSQMHLEGVVRNRLAEYGVVVEFRKALIAIDQGANAVTATIATQQPDGTETQETVVVQYLVGCDGAKGASRRLLGMTFEGETRDTDGILWFDAEVNGLTNDFWHVWGKPEYFTILARPLRATGNKYCIGLTGRNFDPASLVEPTNFIEFFKTEIGRTDLEFGEFTAVSYHRPNIRMANKFQEERCFLVGDSAHVHPPTGGQGINTSIQDACNLTWKLSLVLKNYAQPTLLTSYNDERFPVVAQMLQMTGSLWAHIVSNEQPATKSEGEPEDKTGWFRWRNMAILLYGANYRYSDFVLEERDTNPLDKEEALAHAYAGYPGLGVLRAGDRAPEAPGLVSNQHQTKTSLFELYNMTIHTVLVFAVDGQEQLVTEIIASLKNYPNDAVQTVVIASEDSRDFPGTNVLVDGDGHAHSLYLVQKDTVNVVAVRPDGFIGAIVMDAVGVQRYFSKIFGQDACT